MMTGEVGEKRGSALGAVAAGLHSQIRVFALASESVPEAETLSKHLPHLKWHMFMNADMHIPLSALSDGDAKKTVAFTFSAVQISYLWTGTHQHAADVRERVCFYGFWNLIDILFDLRSFLFLFVLCGTHFLLRHPWASICGKNTSAASRYV